jgi:Uncharacterized protein conserved in bacteria
VDKDTTGANRVPQGPGRRGGTLADPSFDVVSKVDRQVVDNALNQAAKEFSQRFDFRGTGTSIAWVGDVALTIESETEARALAAVDVSRRS